MPFSHPMVKIRSLKERSVTVVGELQKTED
jgi:hypothetical protein